jgi:hypothetical protein
MLLLFSTLIGFAGAAETAACDAKALTKQLSEAAPTAAAELYSQLAACDPKAAKAMAPKVVPHFLAETADQKAAIAAIEVGAPDVVRTWVTGLQSDEKARTIAAIGAACNDSKAVQTFFVNGPPVLGDAFWSDRWYRGLEECRVPAIQSILQAQLERGVGADRSRFVGVLEVYARNLGAGALPMLEHLAKTQQDPEVLSYVVAAFADAARVGTDAADPKVAQEAATIIGDLAPSWPDKAVEQARITLIALGDERASDALVVVRYKSLVQSNGGLLYGTVVVEDAMCKKGKHEQVVHFAEVEDPGQTWPDQLREKVDPAARHAWNPSLAERCKGTGTVDVKVPDAPFSDEKAYDAWVKQQLTEIEKTAVDKRTKLEHEPVAI